VLFDPGDRRIAGAGRARHIAMPSIGLLCRRLYQVAWRNDEAVLSKGPLQRWAAIASELHIGYKGLSKLQEQQVIDVRPGTVIFSVLLSLTLLGCSDRQTLESREIAEHFFSAIAQQDYARAHRFLARPLAQQTPVETLKQFITETGLQEPDNRSWQEAQVHGDRLTLAGTVAAADQVTPIPVRLSLEKEGLHWKIAGLERGVEIASASGPVTMFAPSQEDSALLARQTTADFAKAVQANDLRGFWEGSSDAFKDQYSAEEFEAAFAAFVRDKANLLPATTIDPQFSAPPRVEANGELALIGQFPTSPSRVTFGYRYVQQGGTWKTSGLTISLVPRD